MASHMSDQSCISAPEAGNEAMATRLPRVPDAVDEQAFAESTDVDLTLSTAGRQRLSKQAVQLLQNASRPPIPKLRPAGGRSRRLLCVTRLADIVLDVLNRLRWDPCYDSSDYIIGYVERFEGIAELPLDSWLNETTDEDFIPQHRIRYYKRVSDQRLVWARDTKVDEVFGSGVGSQTNGGAGVWKREICTYFFCIAPADP